MTSLFEFSLQLSVHTILFSIEVPFQILWYAEFLWTSLTFSMHLLSLFLISHSLLNCFESGSKDIIPDSLFLIKRSPGHISGTLLSILAGLSFTVSNRIYVFLPNTSLTYRIQKMCYNIFRFSCKKAEWHTFFFWILYLIFLDRDNGPSKCGTHRKHSVNISYWKQ